MDMCDYCDQPVDFDTVVYVVCARPSDPSELVCVMLGCGKCLHTTKLAMSFEVLLDKLNADHSVHVSATADVLQTYIESEFARINGHLFLTI